MFTVKIEGTLEVVGHINLSEYTLEGWCRANGYHFVRAWNNGATKVCYVTKKNSYQ